MNPSCLTVILAGLALAAPTSRAHATSPAPADTGTVAGTVVDPGGAGVPGVEVLVSAAGLSSTTDSTGRFELRVPAGQQVFIFRKIGYRPQALSVAVAVGFKDLQTITLVPGAFALPEIRVTAKYAKPERYAYTTKYDDFYRRRRLGAGKYLDRETLEMKTALATHEYLQGLAGVRVDVRPAGTGSRVYFLRCNESPPAIGVWVDGRRLTPPWGIQATRGYVHGARLAGTEPPSPENDPRAQFVTYLLESVNPSEIEAMEIYTGPGTIPGEFNTGDVCGVIAIWTRDGGLRSPLP